MFKLNMLNKIRNFVVKSLPGESKEARLVNFYRQMLDKNAVSFDIGANVGMRSEVLLKAGARVIAVEPQSSCCEILRKKFDDNTGIDIIQKAVSNRDNMMMEMMISNETQISTFSQEFVDTYSYQREFNWAGREQVESVTLDMLIHKFGVPYYCKIDVEGYELEVVEGLSENIRLISFEFNRPLKHIALAVIDQLESISTRLYNYISFENPYFELEEWIAAKQMKAVMENLNLTVPTGEIFTKS